jgi:ubiquinone/menaquinone biosynthesis C-methylase UbiE
MLYTRYAYAAHFGEGKNVLELACGAGVGLGFQAKRARTVVGGDLSEPLLRRAHQHYQGKVPLVQLDAHALPFKDASFDVVILFEAIYYLAKPQKCIDECRRVLRREGILLISSANKEWSGFNPSPYSTQYFSAHELHQLLVSNEFEAEIYGAFSVSASTPAQKTIALVRKLAVRWNLTPKTMKGKELLKTIFYGRLVVMGPEIEENMAKPEQLYTLPENRETAQYKVLYAIGRSRTNVPICSSQPALVSMHS